MQRVVEAVAKDLFDAEVRVLWVGKTSRPELWNVADPTSARALSEQPEGAVWFVEQDLCAGLAILRGCLRPGATLLLGVRLIPTLWSSLRARLSRQELARFSSERVCESLLFAGLREPRVWQESAKLLCVSVRMPERKDDLDAYLAGSVDSSQPQAVSER